MKTGSFFEDIQYKRGRTLSTLAIGGDFLEYGPEVDWRFFDSGVGRRRGAVEQGLNIDGSVDGSGSGGGDVFGYFRAGFELRVGGDASEAEESGS